MSRTRDLSIPVTVAASGCGIAPSAPLPTDPTRLAMERIPSRNSSIADCNKPWSMRLALVSHCHHPRHAPLFGVDPLVRCLIPVSYTHLRAHETVLDLVCRLLLE